MLQLNIWKDNLPIHLKMKSLECLYSQLCFMDVKLGTQKKEDKRIEAAEMWSYRCLLRISWKDQKTNGKMFLKN